MSVECVSSLHKDLESDLNPEKSSVVSVPFFDTTNTTFERIDKTSTKKETKD